MELKNLLLANMALFTFAFLLHTIRLGFGGGMNLAGYTIPMWVSAVAVVVLAALLYFNYTFWKK